MDFRFNLNEEKFSSFSNMKFGLLIIDVQNDFIDGSLAIKNQPANEDVLEIIPIINQLIKNINFDQIIYSLDWHPNDHISFYENINDYDVIELNGKKITDKNEIKLFDTVSILVDGKIIKQKLWPKHCVKNSLGSNLHSDLIIKENSKKIFKGTNKFFDSYSAFSDNFKLNKTDLDYYLKSNYINCLFVCGLAMEYCVYETIKEALSLNYKVFLIENCVKGLNKTEIEKTKNELKKLGCIIIKDEDVKNIVKKI